MLDNLPAEKAYRILESGPILLVSTRAVDGRANLMTMGFHMMMQHEPPLVGVIIGPWDHSHRALSDTGGCVMAVPTVDLAETVVDIGNCSGDALDKFAHFGLTPVSAAGKEQRLSLRWMHRRGCSASCPEVSPFGAHRTAAIRQRLAFHRPAAALRRCQRSLGASRSRCRGPARVP